MYEFTNIERIDPNVKPSNERIQNFEEINLIYDEEETASQASRCIQCGNPYCSAVGCPLGNNIPQWLKLIAERNPDTAFSMSNETSPYPEILGRICPQSRLCEGACTLNDGHGAITIGAIEVAINENAFDKGLRPNFSKTIGNKKVAIIGSGPAGLSCATFLLRAGVKPVVYEKSDLAGGLLTYGIPNFKLEKKSVQRRIKWLLEAGMDLHTGVEIGKDISFEKIYTKHHAVFIGLGAMDGKVLGSDSYNQDSIYMARSFLTNIQRKLNAKNYDRKYQVKGKRVLVIGGGDTAMDCVRTSVREGAKEVTCVYRRDEANMPGSPKEVYAAKEEGVKFTFMTTPKNFVADKSGNIYGMKCIHTMTDEKSGRGKLEEVAGSEHILEADVIVLALGFNNEKLTFLTKNGIEIDKWGAIKTNERNETSKPRVFAGGDSVRGADLAVTAALDGREAALHILAMIFKEEYAAF